MKDFGDVARGAVTRQTSRLAKRLAEGTSTREEAIEILSHLIVDRLGREKQGNGGIQCSGCLQGGHRIILHFFVANGCS